ncbi:hypothetical protein [Iningainema tapete]|uniref:Uncharacterized protein n=1 Tax=Iningainema tapete BLCC-T55 TaxID=2748662 RepID=A0A8J7C919_9CYAN|nr:hypothetical protein [Iningainema tapete]MBD2775426.1 hypothetical protein [Iningainema tapete BLCC-T55]
MWEDEIVEELHRIREEHAKAFNYDIRAICADWRKRQEQSGRHFVSLTPPAKPANNPAQRTEQK